MIKQQKKIGFVGGGNMAEALIKGLLRGTLPADALLVSEPNNERRQTLTDRYGIAVRSDNLEVVKECDITILAVKPQVAKEVISGFASAFSDSKFLVSILAGVATELIEGLFDGRPRIVRAMPNTPALVGEGTTALCSGRFSSRDDVMIAKHIFEAVGAAYEISEKQMDAVTGLSGSGPAYIYTVIEALADGGVQEGLPKDLALAMATQTVLGTAKMVRESGEHPAILKDRVCSPGGTTIAGICALEEKGLRSALMEAVSRATARSRELGR